MWKYILKRIVAMIPVLIGVTLIVYLYSALLRAIPFGPCWANSLHPKHMRKCVKPLD